VNQIQTSMPSAVNLTTRNENHRRVGLVTTIPVEVLFAAGVTPVDLNNIFVTDSDPRRLVEQAEVDGFPRNTCSWVKGIYSVVLQNSIDTVITVLRGDCSNNEAMADVLRLKGIEIVPFSYPYPKDYGLLKGEIERLMRRFGVDWDSVNHVFQTLNRVRSLAHEMDDLTWKTEAVSGFENHLWLVSTSDFNSDYVAFESDLRASLANKRNGVGCKDAHSGPTGSGIGDVPSRVPGDKTLRLGYVGVPPIFSDLYQYLEGLGARVVFNEVQRQFSMPARADQTNRNLVQQYLDYTYPYDYSGRIADIEAQVERRQIDALIHYVQSFCHHQIQDMILRQRLKLPILTLEGDKPGPLDARSKMRLEAFVDMCLSKKGMVAV